MDAEHDLRHESEVPRRPADVIGAEPAPQMHRGQTRLVQRAVGGLLGVAVFFTLSGWLITGGLLRDLRVVETVEMVASF